MIGQTILHYRITAKLGEGGMGVVYRAEDTKLKRPVALKFIGANLIRDGDARRRFEREATAAAGISHANVCHVYEIADANEHTFLAMEFVEGESLDKRIERGPLPLKEALDIARQVAEGLAAAHEHGVVHRDIKPGNLLVTPKGQVKILDFGLALLAEGSKLTQLDTKVGTVAYMSPEQAQGMEVDRRTDVWALGCVLYEMVSGRRPFLGHYDQALVYSIVNEPPEPLTGLRTGVPMELEFIVSKCLEKNPGSRYQHTSDIAVDLRNLQDKLKSGRSTILRTATSAPSISSPATVTVGNTVKQIEPTPPEAVVAGRRKLLVSQALAAVFAIAFFGIAAVHFREAPPERTVRRFSFTPEDIASGGLPRTAHISPNGRYILYVSQTDGGSNLWLRSLNDESARELPGTEGAIDGFWSPDSAEVGFAVGTPDNALKRVSIDGNSPSVLCKLPTQNSFSGGTWSPDGERIVFSSGQQLHEIAARGGQPRVLFDATDSPRPVSLYPHFLPSSDGPLALVYSAATTPSNRWVTLLDMETGERRELGPGSAPVYSRDGYLIHAPTDIGGRGLWALPFSLDTLEATGDEFPISPTGFAPSVSHDGALLYRDDAGGLGSTTLVWRSRKGEIIETAGQPQPSISDLALSPDGQRVAVTSVEDGIDVWVHDLARSTKTRLTFGDNVAGGPAWSSSGGDITYYLRDRGRILRRAADGSGEAVPLVESERPLRYPDWSRDGRYLVYCQRNVDARGGLDIHYTEFGSDGKAGEPVPFLASPANEVQPELSPDRKFLAYASNESGSFEIYVRAFPGGGGKWQVSTSGGSLPRWRSDGKEFYYLQGDTLMAVAVSTESALEVGRPQPLFDVSSVAPASSRNRVYDVAADGQRFLTVAPVAGADAIPSKIRIVENWYEEFRGREKN